MSNKSDEEDNNSNGNNSNSNSPSPAKENSSPNVPTPSAATTATTTTNANSTDPQAKTVSQDLRAGALDSNELEDVAANKLTKFYRVPNARFKSAEDIIKYYGYELGDKIAEGGFGVIYKATHLKTKVEVACKQMDMNKSKSKLAVQSRTATRTDDSKMTDMKNELYILQKMSKDSNPFIVKLYVHFVVNNHLYLFIKLANAGNFAKYVKEKGVLTEKEAGYFFSQILLGLDYMHSKSIAHRDMKLDNVLLLRKPSGKLTVLITDFGLSRVIGHSAEGSAEGGKVVLSRTYCGTPGYMAPEILDEKPYNAFQADVWMAGVCLYEMLNGCLPFQQAESKLVLQAAVARDWTWTENVAEEPSEAVRAILAAMLDPDPTTRVTMSALLGHKWIVGHVRYARSFYRSSTTTGAAAAGAGGGGGKSSGSGKSKGKGKGAAAAAKAKGGKVVVNKGKSRPPPAAK